MKVVVLYHPYSEHGRTVEEFAHNYERQKNGHVELLSLETRDGATTATLYDVMQYPTILAIRDDGQVLKVWNGEMLPLMEEVASYAYA